MAREIARVLGCHQKHKNYIEGPKYIVTWALGHLVELAEPEDYDSKYKTWKLEDLPIMPQKMNLKVMKQTSHQFRAIQQLCRRSDIKDMIIATDAGREGELVARWIIELVKWRKPIQRLWISSQTDQAIREGFQKLRPGREFERLYDSAVCRAEADWLIGLNVTRALTSKFDAQLSAGRVQTPTLAMIMEREKEIAEFRPVAYWHISADFGSFQARWFEKEGHDGRIYEKEKAASLIKQLQGTTAVVERIATQQKSEAPPLLYDLTELQRDANRFFGFSAKQTSNVLQKLYEQHKITTYPRTDSRHLTTDMVPTLKARLERLATGPLSSFANPMLRKQLQPSKRFVDNSKVTDHHAIIPTEEPIPWSALTTDERKLFELIAKRFLAMFYPVSRYDVTSVVLRAGDERFRANGKVIREAGWKQLYGWDVTDDADDASDHDAMSDQTLPEFQKGMSFTMKSCRMHDLMTKPPARHTEATLLSRMEKHQLGTPATRADIIERLLNSETIERQQNRLIPTKKGKQLIELVSTDLRSAELTAKWEAELEQIARGKGNKQQFLTRIRQQTKRLVQEVKQSEATYTPHNLTHSYCPDCGSPLLERKSKHGTRLRCSSRECNYSRSAEPVMINKRCPQCRKKMELRNGKAGKFAQCRPCNVVELLDGKNSGRVNKREQQKLVQKYSSDAPLTSSLGDALKAALEKKD